MSHDLAATSGSTEVEERSSSLLPRLLAETFGTFLLTLVIVGALVYSPLNNVGGPGIALGGALGGAFAYIAGAAAVGRVSGAHFNPAISLGAWLGGRTSLGGMFSYWGAQLVGAVLAGAVLFATVPRAYATLLGVESVSDVFGSAVNGFAELSWLSMQTDGQVQFGWLPALLIEIIISAVLVGVYLGANDPRRKAAYAPVAVGSAIAALTLVSWFVTNTGMNPARSTAAAIFANSWGPDGSGRQLWLFWLAPLVGAALAALFYRAFASAGPDEADEYEEHDEHDEHEEHDEHDEHEDEDEHDEDSSGDAKDEAAAPDVEKKTGDKA